MSDTIKEMTRPATTKITFDFPIMIGGKEISNVTMRRQKVRDAMDAEVLAENDSMAAREVALFAILMEIPVEDLMNIDMKEYQKAQDAYAFLMEDHFKTTEKNSEVVSPS